MNKLTCDEGNLGREEGNRRGKENMAKEASPRRPAISTRPSHQAPTHRGSVGRIPGAADRST